MLSQAQKRAGFQADAIPGIYLPMALWDVSAPGNLLPSVQGAGLS